jgi:two-component system response regulator FlrC
VIGLLELGAHGLVRGALERSGANVVRLADSSAALEQLDAERLRALVIDLLRLDDEARELLEAARARRVPVLVVSREHGAAAAVEALRAGASDYLCAPFELDSLLRALDRLGDAARAPAPQGADAFLTQDREVAALLELAKSIAASDATVLIEGESGTGKELLARLVHRASHRAARPLVAVNCAALPAGLLESELFGHERGSFTGAFARVTGKFELAHGGSILLDEIGELELGLQAKLLRTIQEKQVQRIGARLPLDVDFRLIATTNRALGAEVRAGRFREDLFYRLNVLPLRLPPLRERPGDVGFLAHRFLERQAAAGRRPPELAPDALEAMQRHDWPGNVRELENLVERLALLAPGRRVHAAELGLGHSLPPLSRAGGAAAPPFRTLREMERWMIVAALRRLHGNRTQASRELGISLRTLRNKIHEYAIDEPDTLPRSGFVRSPSPRQISPGDA